MEKYNGLAKDIVARVGGKENISGVHHCITRLRFNLVDESKADDEYLKNHDGIITIMKSMGEYMVVIGEHVPYVYEEVNKEIGMNNESVSEPAVAKKKQSFGKTILDIITGSMGPTLNILCASGIIKGLTILLTFLGVLDEAGGVYKLLDGIGSTFFIFLPIVLAFNLAKQLQMDAFLGLLIGAVLCYPGLRGVDIDLFGYVINADYTGSFLAPIFMICAAAPLEKALKKVVPVIVRGFMVPVLVLVVIIPLGFAIIGPVSNLVANGINFGFNFLFDLSPIIAGTILGGLWQVMVLFGIHGVLVTFPFMELMQGRPTQILAFTFGADWASLGVVLAVMLRTKNKKLKSIALPAFASGIFGVTEPAIYGITLPRIKLFVISCIGGAIGGTIAALTQMLQYSYAGMGAIGLLGLLNPDGPQIIPIIMIVVIPFIFTLVVTLFVFKDKDKTNEVKVKVKKEADVKQNRQEVVLSPIKGDVKELSFSADEAFSSGAMGKGVVIVPEDGKVTAPFDGIVYALFPAKHAIGITSDNGCEVLIHIGINTVRLKGEGFEAHVKQGDTVKANQLLISFDKDALIGKGYDLTSPVIVSNSGNYLDVIKNNIERSNNGDALLTVIN